MSFKFNTKTYFVIYYNDEILKFPESRHYSIPCWNGDDYPGPLLSKENKFENFNEAVKNARICLGDFDGCIPKDWNGDKLIVSTTCNLHIEIRKIEEKIPTYVSINNQEVEILDIFEIDDMQFLKFKIDDRFVWMHITQKQ